MLRHSEDPLRLTVITDGPKDATEITEAFHEEVASGTVRVFHKLDADERATSYYGGLEGVAWFRQGHPCWLKITDPPLFARPGEEMILVDPDVYFPNRFRFEKTPAKGILLMRQRPNCLFPPASVRATFRAGYALADHTDIGIAQLVEPVSGPWLNDFVSRVGRQNLPTWSMHIESIVWAAWAMHAGGDILTHGCGSAGTTRIGSALRFAWGCRVISRSRTNPLTGSHASTRPGLRRTC